MSDSLIHEYSGNGNVDGLNELIAQGADINERGVNNTTPLHEASKYGHLKIVKVLLAAGADVNKTIIAYNYHYCNTPLNFASMYDYLEIVKVLLAAGADVDKTNDNGDTPLHYASKYGHLKIVKVLLAAGADVNKTNDNGDTPLHEASINGHYYHRIKIVMDLILAKADVRIKNNEDKLPHEVAATDDIREFIWQHHPWYRRKPLILTRPHPDHETNKEYQLSALGNIITATSDNVPSSHDDVLFQLKMKVAEFL